MSLPLICVTLTGCTVDEMVKDAARATAVGADIVEVRLDKLWVIEQEKKPDEDIKSDNDENKKSVYIPPEFIPQSIDSVDLDSSLVSFRTGIELPVILTCRPERQGGYFPGDEKDRINVLTKAIKSGVSWIDLELDIDPKQREKLVKLAGENTKIISSNHFDRLPSSPDEIIDEINEFSEMGDIIKIVYNTDGKKDALKAIKKALKKETYDFLLEQTKQYAKSRQGEDTRFTPYPSKWFNEERYNDDIENLQKSKRVNTNIGTSNEGVKLDLSEHVL